MPRRLLFLLPIVVLLISLSAVPASAEVKKGEWDLSQWDFHRQPLVRLDGEWEFWWNREVTGPEAPRSPGYDLVQLPSYWNSFKNRPYPAMGTATFHVRLRLPDGQGPWALSILDVASAWRLYANGVEIAQNGVATAARDQYWAHIQPAVVRLPTNSPNIDLYLYVANFSDRAGGIRDSITLGPAAHLIRQQSLSELDSAFFVGGLLVMALFNFVIFFLQRRKAANLWLGVVSFFIAVRTIFTGPRIIYEIWPSLTFEFSAQIVFLSILGAVTSFSLYLKSLFPDFWPTRILIPFLFYSGLFVLLIPFLPVKTYSEAFMMFYDIPMALAGFVFLGIAWWATKKKHEDGPLVFFGMIFLVAGTINDIVYQFIPLPQGDILGRFLFVFLVFNTFLLSRQFSKDYALTQRQAGELRKLDKMKDDFLARVTHELRTPLHGMAGILDAFRMGDFGPLSDRQSYHLGLLEASSRRLLSMVNSILDFSHLRKHQLVSEPRPILLKETVDFLLPSFYPQLKPGVALANRVGGELPAVLGDEVKLEQILHHLVQNSLQHTDQGTVALEAEVRDHQVLLMVKDTGHGIPADKLAQLFSPFHQVAEIDTRITGGLGLGLAISRQLVQQMGGRLELQSKEGSGTTALLWLPICPPAKLQYFQAQRLDRNQHWDQSRFESAVPLPPPLQPPQTTPPPQGGPTILIVDDEPVNLMVLRTFLVRTGYSILEATSGPQALEKMAESVVDLVILDVMMPGMSGYEVCAKLRERFTPARLPVLLLTAKNQVEDLLQGYKVGASDFLTKPFQREELKARMELHLKVSKAARSGTAIPNT